MKTRAARLAGVVYGCVFPFLFACEDEKPPTPAPTAAPSAAPAPTPAPTPSPTAAPAAAAPTRERPTKIDTELTSARRAAIESKYAPAKGFLLAKDLETKLKANKTLKDKKSAITAFDKVARGKWVLFVGPLVNLTDASFDVGLEYSPQLPNDPMGMSRQFFEITATEVEGYQKDAFKAGNVVVVLAKYTGAGKATPGYELVATNVWK